MTRREPKSQTTTQVNIFGRNGDKKGRLEVTSGNINYFRPDAREESGRWSLQRIIELLESDLETQAALEKPNRLPKNKDKNDFAIFVTDIDGAVTEENSFVVDKIQPLRQFDDERKLEHGAFQIDAPYSKKNLTGFTWSVRIGLHTAIYILDLYVAKWLTKKHGELTTDVNVPISKAQFKGILRNWLAKLGN